MEGGCGFGIGLRRAGGDERVKAFNGFLIADAEAGFVAGHSIDFRTGVAPSYTQEHVGYVTLVTGAVVDRVELMEEIAGRIGEGMLLESELAVEVEESGFGADQVLEADFAEGDFGDG